MTVQRSAVENSTGPEDAEDYRRELTGYCYRMLGSAADAEDAVQEVMLKAWRAEREFEHRSSLRSWLYRIATNTCMDAIRASPRRATPMQLGPSRPPVEESLTEALPEGSWVSPIADERISKLEADPAEHAETRETVRLAFVAALQLLPARQRAVLIFRDVLRWRAAEVGALLEISSAAVNSALQRARATLSENTGGSDEQALDPPSERLLTQYIDAFERYDIDAFTRLLHADAVQTMPPLAMWLSGSRDIGRWMRGVGAECEGSRVLPLRANGCPAFAQYRIDPAGGHRPWGLHVVEAKSGLVSAIHTFLDADFETFGLPAHL